MLKGAATQLLDRGFVVAGRGPQHAGGVAQRSVGHELGVVTNTGTVDQAAQRLGGLVAIEPGEHRCRHRQAGELGAEELGREVDRRLRVGLRSRSDPRRAAQ